MYYAAIALHDKVWGASLLGGYRAHDAVEMAFVRDGWAGDVATERFEGATGHGHRKR